MTDEPNNVVPLKAKKPLSRDRRPLIERLRDGIERVLLEDFRADNAGWDFSPPGLGLTTGGAANLMGWIGRQA